MIPSNQEQKQSSVSRDGMTWNVTSAPHILSRRSPVLSLNGAVASSQATASEIGMRILHQGGNCVDAAIAIAAALNVTEPCSTGLGGDCFALYYEAATNKVYGLNGSGRSPAALTLDKALHDVGDAKAQSFPIRHIHTVTVPGAAAGWVDAVEKWGRLSMTQILAPAIELADKGYTIGPVTAHCWQEQESLLQSQQQSVNQALNANESCPFLLHGAAPHSGDILTNPALAQTFRLLAQHGKDGFYRGAVAESIVKTVTALGGCMTMQDLANHTTTFPDPITVNYKGVDVWEIPPNGQGITALVALNILEGLDIQKQSHHSAPFFHRIIESLRLAFADTRWYVTDPDHAPIPVQELLSKSYAAKRREQFCADRAAADIQKGTPTSSSDTVSFCVVDGQGNACSFINSNYMGFGSCIVAPQTGFSLQNRGHNFSLIAHHPNVLAPNKRPYHTIIPGMATKDGKLYCPFTVMGGFMQPQGHVQVLVNMIDFQMDPQTALDVARICIQDGTSSGEILIEEGISEQVVEQLKAMGHPVKLARGTQRTIFGRGQIIKRADNGVLWTGTDSRADGIAIGF